jgi:hypothetical protein
VVLVIWSFAFILARMRSGISDRSKLTWRCDLTEKEILCDICYADPEMSVLALIRKDEPPFLATRNVLGKPFTASELLNAVRRCLAAH